MSKRTKKVFSVLMIMIMMISVVSIQTDSTYAAGPRVRIKGAKYPTSITKGKKYTVKGKIVSKKKIKRVEIGIVKASTNKWTKYKYNNKKVKAKSFNIKKAAKKLKFNKLAAGDYYYRIYVHTKRKPQLLLNEKFTVNKKVKKTVSNDKDNVVISDYNYPTNYNVGSSYDLKGKISCNNTIKRVEVGVVVTATNKWTQYKYDNKKVDAKSFDIADADSTLKFGGLPAGSFTYRIYVHTENGPTLVLNSPFTVNPTDKPQQAINWAAAIAADDQYTYGKGYGGFFTCCVCAGKTAKKADAKFTCMPFLAAAYAHGTGNPNLMNNGRHIMNLNDDNFKGTLGGAWFKIGLCKDLTIDDLMPGDVIIKWCDKNENGHSWMYGGGDSIIEAVPSDIRVLDTGAAGKLKKYGSSEGTPSKNYVMRYRG